MSHEKSTIAPREGNAETRSVIAPEHTPPRDALCLLVSTSHGVQVIPLGSGEIVLGRAQEADVTVEDDSVSRRHARLVIERDRITITDLASRNGTRLDGLRLEPGDLAEMQIGSSFELGSTTIVLQRAEGFLDGGRSTSTAREVTPMSGQPVDGPLVRDPAMQRLYALLDVIGPTQLTVLILGETGVGKEIFAETLHQRSDRASKPFLQLNCAAVAATLLESELFGHEKGAFTGADRAKEGLFEAADGGTLFLDEVGELPLPMQATLLRALAKGEVMRVGSVKPKRVDVRIVSATNRDLRALIVEGRFRSDLYFRLNGMSVKLPPLRKRTADIVPLAKMFIERAAARGKKRAPKLTADAEEALLRYPWPGNVRELLNAVDRAVAICGAGMLAREHLQLEEDENVDGFTEEFPSRSALDAPSAMRPPPQGPPTDVRIPVHGGPPPRETPVKAYTKLDDITREAVLDALSRAAGNQSEAAKVLGITRRALIYRIEQYGIARPRKK